MARHLLAWLVVVLAIAGVVSGLGYYKYSEIQSAIAAAASFPEPQEAVQSVRVRQGEWTSTASAVGTVVALRQDKGWTYGALANHIWSVAGSDGREDVVATFLQPFLSYTWPTATTLTLNTEATYDWNSEDWNVPINLLVSQVMKFGGQPVSLQLGGRWYAESPDGGPEWGLRFTLTFLFPK